MTDQEENNPKKVDGDILLWDKKDLQAINNSRYADGASLNNTRVD